MKEINSKSDRLTLNMIKDIYFTAFSLNKNNFNGKAKDYTSFSFNTDYIKSSFSEWENHFEKNKKTLFRPYCFLDLFLAGFLFKIDPNDKANSIDKDKISEFSNGNNTRFSNIKKKFAAKINNTAIRTTINDISISEGALTLRIIYEAQKRGIEKLKTYSNNSSCCEEKLCRQLLGKLHEFGLDTLICNLNNISIGSQNEESDLEILQTLLSDPARFSTYTFLLALDFSEAEAYKLLYTRPENGDSKSARAQLFNPDIDIYAMLKSPDFYVKLLSQNGIIGTSSSLALIKDGMEYYNAYLSSNKSTANINLDGYSLLLLSNVFYYQTFNTAQDNDLVMAYIFSCLAQKTSSISCEAEYNLGYYHYVLSQREHTAKTSNNDRFSILKRHIEDNTVPARLKDSIWLDYQNKYGTSMTVSAQHLSTAIIYFTKICEQYPAAYTSLGNIAARETEKPQLTNTDKNKITQCLKRSNKQYSGIELSYDEIALQFYKLGAENNHFEAMYNYVRHLEKKYIQQSSNTLEKLGIQDPVLEIKIYLSILYQYKHPKGSNIYLLYVLYTKARKTTGIHQHLDVTAEELEFTENIYKSNEDLLPCINNYSIINSEKALIDLDDEELKCWDDFIKNYKYISSYTFAQLNYYWPIYHYCLFKFRKIQSAKELIELRQKLMYALSDEVLLKEPDYKEDRKRAYLLLLKIANYSNPNTKITNSILEQDTILAYIKDKINTDINPDPVNAPDTIDTKIYQEYNNLTERHYSNIANNNFQLLLKKMDDQSKTINGLKEAIADLKKRSDVSHPPKAHATAIRSFSKH